ncbi:hypothetical protein DIPPA_26885 [Diplonema papillatum]|nr:hypothetical protein DIPPA_26885 [Diplonema papillatum]
MSVAQRAAKKGKKRLWTGLWRRLAHRVEPPEVTRSQDKALVAATLEFDYSIRHRLHSKRPRALAVPFDQGRWDTSFALIQDQTVCSRPSTLVAADGNWCYVSIESKLPLPFVENILQRTLGMSGQQQPSKALKARAVSFQPHSGLNDRWALLARVQDTTRTTGGALLQASTQNIVAKVVAAGPNGWPGTTVRHQCAFRLLRAPLLGSFASVERALERVKSCGFLNFYALPCKRVRQHTVPPHFPVSRYLSGDVRGALDLALSSMACASRHTGAVFRMWKNNTLTDEQLSRHLGTTAGRQWRSKQWYTYRAYLRGGLDGCWKALDAALKRDGYLILRNMIWNYMASMRLSLYGFRPTVGDLVQDCHGNVKHVSEDTLHSYTIYDVVIPVVTLPFSNSDTMFPKHTVGANMVEEVLSDFGISLSEIQADGRLFNEWKHLFSAEDGTYQLETFRRLVVRPNNLSWTLTGDSPLDHMDLGSYAKDKLPISASTRADRLVITADLPSTSCMSCLTREVLISPLAGQVPPTWRAFSLRPGAMITADADPAEPDVSTLSDEELRELRDLV